MNELDFLEGEIDKLDDILSISVTKQETSRASKLHNQLVDDYYKKLYTLDTIIEYDEEH